MEKNLELIDWVESNANESLKFSLSVTELLLKDAGTLLNMLIAAIGGAIAFLIPSIQGGNALWITGSIAVSGVYLAVVGSVLMHKVIRTAEMQTPGNLPSSLYQESYSLAELKIAENKNIEIKRGRALSRNVKMAKWLDITRYLTLATPLIFTLSVLVFRLALVQEGICALLGQLGQLACS